MRSLSMIVFSTALGLAGPASSATHLGDCSLNGVTVTSEISVGYDGPGSVPADFSMPPPVTDMAVPAASFSATAINSANQVPATGAAKDQVDGTLKSAFEFGTPIGSTAFDTFEFEASGNGSAVLSQNLAGMDSDATVVGIGKVEFFNDIVGGIDCDGFLHLSDVRNLLPNEVSFSVEVIQDPNLPGATSVALLGPGDAGQVVPIVEDKGYLVRFDYDYRVPFGTDPAFSFMYSFRAASTPVIPALSNRGAVALGMVLLGAAGLALRVGRARSA